MNKIIIGLFILFLFSKCGSKNNSIDFVSLKENEFNSKVFQLPYGKIPDSAKQAHDSCMNFAFDANAILAYTKNTFFIGDIVNRHSLTVLNSLKDLGLTEQQIISEFHLINTSCYEKRALHFPSKFILGENFRLSLPDADAAINKEINDAILSSNSEELQSGPWVYLDMKNALKSTLDTIHTEAGLRYKKNLLDTNNMILTTMEGITSASFVISTNTDISKSLQALLLKNRFVLIPGPKFSIQLFYIDNRKFQMALNGFFPAIGDFARVETK